MGMGPSRLWPGTCGVRMTVSERYLNSVHLKRYIFMLPPEETRRTKHTEITMP